MHVPESCVWIDANDGTAWGNNFQNGVLNKNLKTSEISAETFSNKNNTMLSCDTFCDCNYNRLLLFLSQNLNFRWILLHDDVGNAVIVLGF